MVREWLFIVSTRVVIGTNSFQRHSTTFNVALNKYKDFFFLMTFYLIKKCYCLKLWYKRSNTVWYMLGKSSTSNKGASHHPDYCTITTPFFFCWFYYLHHKHLHSQLHFWCIHLIILPFTYKRYAAWIKNPLSSLPRWLIQPFRTTSATTAAPWAACESTTWQ